MENRSMAREITLDVVGKSGISTPKKFVGPSLALLMY
jgi:hypothetical protein